MVRARLLKRFVLMSESGEGYMSKVEEKCFAQVTLALEDDEDLLISSHALKGLREGIVALTNKRIITITCKRRWSAPELEAIDLRSLHSVKYLNPSPSRSITKNQLLVECQSRTERFTLIGEGARGERWCNSVMDAVRKLDR